jgi:signal transduction histidine kinase/CheY-like chemotaxis protein
LKAAALTRRQWSVCVSGVASAGWLTDVAAIGLATLAGALLTLAVLHSFTLRRFGRRTRADERELERLRDQIWELRAAAEDRDRAEAASEAKSRFLATVSHEVRTPLNGILGMADLLTATSIDDEQKSYIEAIRDSGQSLGSLIEDLLDLSRIEAGKLDIVNERFAVAPLVESVVELLAPRAHDKGLEIASFVAPDVPAESIGDAARLRQVLLNLAGNAVKFTERGGVGLRVVGEGDALVISVTDTGPGVPFDRREAIFQDFEQGDEATARQHGGTGLGLAISRRLVERMGGRLWLANSSESGSTFAITLPLAAGAGGAEPDSHMARQRVLIASPSQFGAPYIGERLAACGAEVACARTESETLSRLHGQAAPPETILVDCAFGEAATAKIAEAARAADVRRLFILFSPTERRALNSETLRRFDGWLVKPVRSASLLARFVPQITPAGAQHHVGRDAQPKLEAVSILLAEDNEISRRVALKHLERHGARVKYASDGAEAVRLANDHAFDVIILDIRMPVLDGLAAARQIRAAEAAGERTPLVALTANAFSADRHAAVEAGIDYFIAKPVDPFDLVALIETALTRAQRPKYLQPTGS